MQMRGKSHFPRINLSRPRQMHANEVIFCFVVFFEQFRLHAILSLLLVPIAAYCLLTPLACAAGSIIYITPSA